ncbi:MAG: glutamate--tRNA ligase [Hirschia sp.]|nr:glutamate--tRNA ligase [Hirschia sp.]MBF18019.1 glutamate--tRNA ligase [Hirschia sp.]
MTVVTRFAPSPTGYLHIGGARTALFNWLYAKAKGGKFLLRIEDTDRERSTTEAVDALLAGLQWMGIEWDDPPVYQHERANRHREVAEALIATGHAFRCYVTQEELTERREAGQEKRVAAKAAEGAGNVEEAAQLRAQADELLAAYRSPYRDGAVPENSSAPHVVRLKAPDQGRISFTDAVQGDVGVDAASIDDLVLLRADGTPTYMLAVVVDDHDMGVTQIIRGDDHLTNTYRQLPIYSAMKWTAPNFAHVPLIHGPDGKKLSKRHGALGVEAYRELGYLPESLRNYLLRLGWSHGDDEIISDTQAMEWFDLPGLGRSPARLDLDKLSHINAHYMTMADDSRLFSELLKLDGMSELDDAVLKRVKTAISGLKARSSTICDMRDQAGFLFDIRPIELSGKLRKKVDDEALERLARLRVLLSEISDWSVDPLEATLSGFCADEGIGMGKIGPALRAALTGGAPSPDLSVVLYWLGQDETLARINDQITKAA